MPRQHLARQAAPGLPVRQQLDALARLHARIRREQPATVRRRLVVPDGVTTRGDHHHCCAAHGPGSQLSPSGDFVLVLCAGEIGFVWWDWQSCSAEMRSLKADADDNEAAEMGSQDDGDEDDGDEDDDDGGWLHPCMHGFTTCAVGWSPIGSVCVVATGICPEPHAAYYPGLGIRPRSDSASDSELDTEPSSFQAPAQPPAVICAFDSVSRSWLQHPLWDVLPNNAQTIEVCDSATLPVAAVCGHTIAGEDAVVIVFQVTTSCVHLVPLPAERRCSLLWLPGSHTLVLLQADRLAWLDVLAWSSPDTHSADWAPLPEPSKPESFAMAACPRGRALWVVQAISELTDGYRFCVSVHTPAHRACLGTWSLDIQGAEQHNRFLGVATSCQAVAVSFGDRITCVYSLSGPTALGQLLFRVNDELQGLAFSGDGCHMVAYQRSCSQIAVLQTSTGVRVAGVRVAGISNPGWNGLERSLPYIHTAAWGLNADQLLVSSVPEDEVGYLSFSVLQW